MSNKDGDPMLIYVQQRRDPMIVYVQQRRDPMLVCRFEH